MPGQRSMASPLGGRLGGGPLTEHLSSVAAITDDQGTLLDQQRYLPFGAERPNVGSITQTDFGYTGQSLRLWAQGRATAAGCRLARRDIAGMGLMDYKARMFDSTIGRFIQPDSIIPNPADPQSWNRYSYVFNNPLLFTDPTGHFGNRNDDKSDYWNKRNQEKVKQLEQTWERERAGKGLQDSLDGIRKEFALDPTFRPFGDQSGISASGGKRLWAPTPETCTECVLELVEGVIHLGGGMVFAAIGLVGLGAMVAEGPAGLIAAPVFGVVAAIGVNSAMTGWQELSYIGTEKRADGLPLIHIFFPDFMNK